MSTFLDLSAFDTEDRPLVTFVTGGEAYPMSALNLKILRAIAAIKEIPTDEARAVALYDLARLLVPTAPPDLIDLMSPEQLAALMQLATDPSAALEAHEQPATES